MSLFGNLFGLEKKQDSPDLLLAIEYAVSSIDPQLKSHFKYPNAYRKSVMNALEYAHSLADHVPGPVEINLETYAQDTYVHAIFPSMDFVSDAFRLSHSIQNYLRENNSPNEIYALMGMRRREKAVMGMELSGEIIQREVPQHMVYFTSHTIVNPAPSEQLSRGQVAWVFFKNLVSKVKARIVQRKNELQLHHQEMDLLMARLHAANEMSRPALRKELDRLLSSVQDTTQSLDIHSYWDDFNAVFLNPEQYLHLKQSVVILDRLGIKRESDEVTQGESLIFNELIGFDRRDWTVIMVNCRNMKSETFAARLETEFRKLSL